MLKNFSIFLERFGDLLQKNRSSIQMLQWGVISFYLLLLVAPNMLPLPSKGAYIWNNLVVFAQFIFWGIWWPFVIFSMLVSGRLWCGIFCPEGALTEWTSKKFGRNKTIPRFLKWRGWPALAFVLTTIYGQLISVYDYPKPALLILGGSTLAAMLVGFLYGQRGTRVWCRYLCPVSGVFNLLSRLAPLSFKTDKAAWQNYKGPPPPNPQCAPMINIHQLHGVSACHMCGRCSSFRNAVSLTPRSPNEEIIRYGYEKTSAWSNRLLFFGMIGVALGAFTWTLSPWFVAYKQFLATWLIEHNIFWPLNANAPWWVLTHYPSLGDSFNWLDGFCIVTYIGAFGVFFGVFLSAIMGVIGKLHQNKILPYHLAQSLLPLAAAGLFLGLSATTVKLLGYSAIFIPGVKVLRALLLSAASIWSFYLATQILKLYYCHFRLYLFSCLLYGLSLCPIIYSWWLMFWGWSH